MRVVVLRSSRYLPLALRVSAGRWPHADIAVVAQTGAGDECVRAAHVFEFTASRFSLWTWWRSTTRRRVHGWRPDEVVVQLPVPGTHRSASLGLVALWIAPHGFWFVLPTGELQFMSPWRWLADLCSRAAWMALVPAAVVSVAVGSILAWPAYQRSCARVSRGGA